MSKYKMTGCARFLIFLVIFIPIAYFGASYLRTSGLWDKFAGKVEGSGSNSIEEAIERKKVDPSTFDTNNSGLSDLQDKFDRLRDAYEEQELIIADQDKKLKARDAEIERLRAAANNQRGTTTSSSGGSSSSSDYGGRSESSSSSSTSRTGDASLDDLLNEADRNVGTTSSTNNRTTGQNVVGSWSFSFSGATGTIEFIEQSGRLMSRTKINGDSRTDIDELTRSGDRFTVRNSQTGEYYVLLRNGDLEAHDRNGYQTTCRRR